MSADTEKLITELVLKALDGDIDCINNLDDRVLRSKAKAAFFKAKKDPESYRQNNYDTSQHKDGERNKIEDPITDYVLRGLDGNMDEINAIEDRVLRGKIKAALVKAKKDPISFKLKAGVKVEESAPSELEENKVEVKKSLNARIKNLAEIKFPKSVLNEDVEKYLLVDPKIWYQFSIWLKAEETLLFDSLQCQTGFDLGDGVLEARYNLHSMKQDHYTEIRIQVDKNKPEIPSVESVWRIADWFERETYDMLGIVFKGHRDMRRILLPDDWEGWPLRKDYQVQETYHGIVIPKMKEGWE
jgi:NADH-quinone oxidoreductase subunit C